MIDLGGIAFWAIIGAVIGFVAKLIFGRNYMELVEVLLLLPFFLGVISVVWNARSLDIPQIASAITDWMIELVQIVFSAWIGAVAGVFLESLFGGDDSH